MAPVAHAADAAEVVPDATAHNVILVAFDAVLMGNFARAAIALPELNVIYVQASLMGSVEHAEHL